MHFERFRSPIFRRTVQGGHDMAIDRMLPVVYLWYESLQEEIGPGEVLMAAWTQVATGESREGQVYDEQVFMSIIEKAADRHYYTGLLFFVRRLD